MFSKEFESNKILQWALGAVTFTYFLVFLNWINLSTFTKEAWESLTYVCPPYFQSCGFMYVLEALPFGYSQTILYMVFFGILVWCVYLFSEKAWQVIQICLIPVFVWHALNTLVFTDLANGNYEYYLIAFAVVLLFFPHKEFFLKLTLVSFYFLSTIAKIHPSWVEGAYFTALKDGLPFFPDWSIPVWTNLVIFMEMVGSWFLMSKNRLLQKGALIFFVIFHLYSGIFVAYRYPATVLPLLLILFGPWYRYSPVPLDRKSLIGWTFILFLFLFQFSPKLILGDEKLSLEGNKYGLYMFEANHQCISEAIIHYADGTTKDITVTGEVARNRCAPYTYWFRLKQYCIRGDDRIDRIDWTFDHSINGGPLYRIVDTQNVCALEYHAFTHNDWIRLESDADIIGWPVKNYYW